MALFSSFWNRPLSQAQLRFSQQLADFASLAGVRPLQLIRARTPGIWVYPLLGVIAVEPVYLERLPATSLSVIAAHEIGHVWVYARAGLLPKKQLLTPPTARQSFAKALTVGLCQFFRASIPDYQSQSLSERLRHEILADAFACYFCGGLEAWDTATRDFLAVKGHPFTQTLARRREALRRLTQSGDLQKVIDNPELLPVELYMDIGAEPLTGSLFAHEKSLQPKG